MDSLRLQKYDIFHFSNGSIVSNVQKDIFIQALKKRRSMCKKYAMGNRPSNSNRLPL